MQLKLGDIKTTKSTQTGPIRIYEVRDIEPMSEILVDHWSPGVTRKR